MSDEVKTTPSVKQRLFTISKDGVISFKVGTVITLIASLLAGGVSIGGIEFFDLLGPDKAVIERIDKLEASDAEKRELIETIHKIILRTHKFETTVDGKPIDLDSSP